MLSSNIDNRNEPRLSGYKKYIIKEVNGRRIAIIGYTTTDTPILTSAGKLTCLYMVYSPSHPCQVHSSIVESTGDLVFHDVVQSVRDAVQTIQRTQPSINIFIAVGHAGFDVDKKVAKEVDEIDIVVGGHSNTFLYTGLHFTFLYILR